MYIIGMARSGFESKLPDFALKDSKYLEDNFSISKTLVIFAFLLLPEQIPIRTGPDRNQEKIRTGPAQEKSGQNPTVGPVRLDPST